MIRDTSAQDIRVQSSKMRKLSKPLFFTLVTGAMMVSLLVYAMQGTNESVSTDMLQLATVERGTLIRDVIATGNIVAANAPVMYSPQSGHVKLLAEPGETVAHGQIVAEIDSPELTNTLRQQESVLASLEGELEGKRLDAKAQELALTRKLELSKVDLDAAEREEHRAQEAMKEQLINQIAFNQAIDELAKAKLNYRLAGQEVQIAKDTLAYQLKRAGIAIDRQKLVVEELNRQVDSLKIRSPVEGIVGNHLVQQMAAVSQSQPLISLVDLSAFEAQLQVPESYAGELSPGMVVELKIGASQIIGSLKAVSPEVRNREVTARVTLPENTPGLRQNQRLSARILLEERDNVLMVKRGAFMQSGGYLTYRVEGDQASRINISTGASSVSHVELLGGVKEGDTLVISELTPFHDQQRVTLR